MKEIFGNKLLYANSDPSFPLPSPQELLHKIIIKGKTLAGLTSGDAENDDEDAIEEINKMEDNNMNIITIHQYDDKRKFFGMQIKEETIVSDLSIFVSRKTASDPSSFFICEMIENN